MIDGQIFPESHDHLYVLRDHRTGCIKVGRAEDPDFRVGRLQTGCPGDLGLVGIVQGGGWIEPVIHQLFAAHAIRAGEWYEADSPIGRLAKYFHATYPGGAMLQLGELLIKLSLEELANTEGEEGVREAALQYRSLGQRFVEVADGIDQRLELMAAANG